MRILGIETSCDETAVAVIDIGNSSTDSTSPPQVRSGDVFVKILSNVVSSQAKLHAKFGGVVPNLAKREHQRNLVPVLLMALKKAGLLNSNFEIRISKLIQNSKFLSRAGSRDKILNSILEREPELFARLAEALVKRARIREHILPVKPPKIDAIAVTVGPGLEPALWVGVNFARALSFLWKKPIIPVNHLEGHIYTNLLMQIGKLKTQSSKLKTFEFPAIALLVSGGHTELVLVRGYGKYRVIGETLDDAAGEAFDKVAKMLGLGFPGGPPIAAAAEMEFKVKSSKLKVVLPRPMIGSKDFNFSFSGLKTAVLYALRDLTTKLPLAKIRPAMAREFQDAVIDVLVAKTIKAAKELKVKTVMIGGGVAANQELRKRLGQKLQEDLPGIRYLMPDTCLTGDNALMIALAAYFGRHKKTAQNAVRAVANLRLGHR